MLTNSPVVFFSVITVLAASLHLYLWARLIRSTTRPGRSRLIGTFTMIGLFLLGTVGFVITRTVGIDARWLAWPGYVWIGLLFYLLLTLLVLEIPRTVLTLWWRRSGNRPVDTGLPAEAGAMRVSAASSARSRGGAVVTSPEEQGRKPGEKPDGAAATGQAPGSADSGRRLFLARACALTACGVAAGMVGYGMRTAFGDLRTVRATVPVKGLDPRLSGFRIALISDTHFGPFLDKGLAERLVTLVNREQPDMVAIAGDLADGSVAEVGPATEPLRGLESRLGTYFATGNHEYSSGDEEWVNQVRELGMRPLLNERTEIQSGGAAFDLAGVNDLAARIYDRPGPDFDAAMKDRDPSRTVILLAHQPIQVYSAVKYGVDLQLSGHTHGGQTVPFDIATGLQQPVVAGLATRGRTSIFVTRGAGFFGPPVRAGIPPEFAIVELQPRP